MTRDVADAVKEISARVDYVASELIEALRLMNSTVRELDESLRKSIDEAVHAVRQLGDAKDERRAEAQPQDNELAERVVTELQALRRRLPVKGKSANGIDEKTMDEIVNRISDEVEIRVAAAVKPKPARKRS